MGYMSHYHTQKPLFLLKYYIWTGICNYSTGTPF